MARVLIEPDLVKMFELSEVDCDDDLGNRDEAGVSWTTVLFPGNLDDVGVQVSEVVEGVVLKANAPLERALALNDNVGDGNPSTGEHGPGFDDPMDEFVVVVDVLRSVVAIFVIDIWEGSNTTGS